MPSHKTAPSLPITRRALLRGASAISILSLFPRHGRASPASFDLDAFLALSKEQLGRAELSKDMATGLLKAFLAIGREDALAALAAGKEDPDLANTLITSWYVGGSPDPDDPQAMHYTDALIWDAMDYTKPMAYCGGAMGYWAEPPEA